MVFKYQYSGNDIFTSAQFPDLHSLDVIYLMTNKIDNYEKLDLFRSNLEIGANYMITKDESYIEIIENISLKRKLTSTINQKNPKK